MKIQFQNKIFPIFVKKYFLGSQFGQCKMDVPLHEVLDSQCAMYHYHLTFSLKMAGQEHTRSQIEQIRELSANHCPVTMRTFGEIVTQVEKLEKSEFSCKLNIK